MRRTALALTLAAAAAACSPTPDGPTPGPDVRWPDLRQPDSSRDRAIPDRSTADAFPAPTPDDCIKDVSAGDHVYDCEGLTFDVTVPTKCLGAPCGLVVDVHGLTMSGKMQDNNTGMRALGKQYGYVVLQPNAKPTPPFSSWSESDDQKVKKMMQRVLAVWHLDTKRVHFTGFSQGGAMTWRFICNHLDLLASAAPAAAACSVADGSGCFATGKQPNREFPLLYMHGSKDPLASYTCATAARDAVVARWQLTTQKTLAQDASHTWTRYSNAKGTVFEFVSHAYTGYAALIGGHCFPGSTDSKGGVTGQLFGFACQAPNAFSWGKITMEFFVAHPKP